MPATTLPATPARPAELSHQVMEQAAEWYALLRSGEATEADRSGWQAWLDGHADHRRAWGYVEAVSRNFDPIHSTADPKLTADNLLAANTRVLRRRRVLSGIAGLAGAGLLVWLTPWHSTPLPGMALALAADHRTATGEVRYVALSDGTHAWLNTATAFNEDYSASRRRLHLLRGEILIATAHDAQRPFYVDTAHGQLQALGTRFTVRLEERETFIAVYEGAVEVRTEAGVSTVVQSGQQLRFSADALADPETADIAREAWSRGMLVARNIPLAEVVQELRRYRSGHLDVAPEVAGLRVFGNFPLRDTDETLALLGEALPVRIHRRMAWWVSIEPKGAATGTGR